MSVIVQLFEHSLALPFFRTSKVKGGGQEEIPHVQGEQMHGGRRAERSYSIFKVRRGGSEEIALDQGKEQWLHFVGATVKRYPTSKVKETQVGW